MCSGSLQTFAYDSAHWSTNSVLNVNNAASGISTGNGEV